MYEALEKTLFCSGLLISVAVWQLSGSFWWGVLAGAGLAWSVGTLVLAAELATAGDIRADEGAP